MTGVERLVYPRLFSTVAGLLLVVIGLAGFSTSAGFRNPEITADLLGLYPVNGWANAFHLVAGLAGLGLARPLPRVYALPAGLVFLALGVSGILAPNGELLLGGLPAARSVNLLNLVIGALGLAAFTASRWDRLRSGAVRLTDRFRRWLDRRRQRRRRRRAARRRRSAPSATGSRPRKAGSASGPRKADSQAETEKPAATSRTGSGDADRPARGRR